MQVAHTSRQFMEEIPKLKREEEIFQLFFFFLFLVKKKKKAAAAAADWCDLNHIRMRISNSFSHSPICSLEIPSIYFFSEVIAMAFAFYFFKSHCRYLSRIYTVDVYNKCDDSVPFLSTPTCTCPDTERKGRGSNFTAVPYLH